MTRAEFEHAIRAARDHRVPFLRRQQIQSRHRLAQANCPLAVFEEEPAKARGRHRLEDANPFSELASFARAGFPSAMLHAILGDGDEPGIPLDFSRYRESQPSRACIVIVM